MRNQAAFGKRVSRAFVCSLIAVVIFLCSNIWVSRAEYVDPGSTEPAAGVEKNGFLALAEYDKPENGGNNDRAIDSNDAVFSKLRLWRDSNHNGVAEPSELTSLPDSQIESISLAYRESRRRDRFGNEFRYRARVYGPKHSDLGRWAYDVFLVGAP